MPRQVRDARLESAEARRKLRMTAKPHYRLIEPGLHLGYRRRASGPGAWVVRRHKEGGGYSVENLRASDGRLIVADDFSKPDGATILSFGQAQTAAKAVRALTPEQEAAGPYTV